MRSKVMAAVVLAALALAGAAQAAEVKVLSAAAVSPGLAKAAAAYQARTGHHVTIAYANGPEIQQRIGGGEAGFDIVVAPQPILAALSDGGRLKGPATPLGRVGVAAGVKGGAPRPDLADTEAFKRSLLAAKTIVISRGSTGVYLEGLFQRLGITEALAPKLVREQNGAAVVERVLRGEGAEIGLSAQTELALGQEHGFVVAGPIPAAVQNATLYAAVAFPAAAAKSEVAGFMDLLRGAESKAMMVASGIE